jgi:hypothetical protein
MGRTLGIALALGITWLAAAPAAEAQEIPQQIRGNCCSCNSQIKFRNDLDLLRLGGRLIPTPAAVIDPLLTGMAVELSNANGTLASIVIPPGAFTEKPSGRKWVYKDPAAKASGGAFVVTLQERNDQLGGLILDLKYFGDLSGATLADMETIVVIGTSSFFDVGAWTQKSSGWRRFYPRL